MRSELQTRSISALAMLAIAGLAAWFGGIWFVALLGFVVAAAAQEYLALTKNQHAGYHFLGALYVALPILALAAMRLDGAVGFASAGFAKILMLAAIIAAVDIGAYATGRIIGGPKLAPTISPGKTWAGFFGGVLAGVLVGTALQILHPVFPYTWFALVAATLLGIQAQLGDLFESCLKRQAGVKDSGTLIPGHGGVLDRVDGYMFTAPLMWAMLFIWQWWQL